LYITLLLRSFASSGLAAACLFWHLGLPLRGLRLPFRGGLPGLFSLRALDTLPACGFTGLNVTRSRRCWFAAFRPPPALHTRDLTRGFDALQRIIPGALFKPPLDVTRRRLWLPQFVRKLVLGSRFLREAVTNVGAGWPALGGQSSRGWPLSGLGKAARRSR
jgi:hypothetical protein